MKFMFSLDDNVRIHSSAPMQLFRDKKVNSDAFVVSFLLRSPQNGFRDFLCIHLHMHGRTERIMGGVKNFC